MTSKPPWEQYPVLQAQLADGPPPFTQLSGDFRRICAMLEPFYEANLIIQADPELYHLQEQWSTIEPSGSTHIRPQPPHDNPYDRPFWDMAVCHRMVLAPSGSRIARGAMDEGARMGDLDDDYWQRVHNQPLWHRYPSLYEQVLAILVAADPIGICDGGERRAAYTPEVNTILPRLKEAQSADDLIRIVREELIVWFGATAVRQDGSKGIGRTLWDLIQQPHHQAEIQTIPPGDAAGLKASGAAPNTLA